MSECQNCGVTSQGAFLVETSDGTMLCEDCAVPGECKRCGRETDETTLAGDWLCAECQGRRRDQHDTRSADQAGLDQFEEGPP